MRTLTPSTITAWLDCAHYPTLLDRVDAGHDVPRSGVGSFAQLLMDKGLAHEREYLEALRAEGRTVFEVPGKRDRERFDQWAARVAPVLGEGHDVLYQMPFLHDGIRGVADFLIRVDGPTDLGDFGYEPVDAKLARLEAKPGHVLQLCFYADAIEALQGIRPARAHLHLGSGVTETLALPDVSAYWRRLRRRLRAVLAVGAAGDTTPVPCSHCEFCQFAPACEAQWRDADALHYVAGIRSQDIETLVAGGVTTRAALAAGPADVDLRPERLSVLHEQAELQVAAVEGQAPPFRVIPPVVADPEAARRRQLPAPDDADVFLDFEGHPFWSASRGLFFLAALWRRDGDGTWGYEARWAHSPDEEAAGTGRLIEWIAERRERHPGMHVYHYNHTERSSLERLATEHGTHEQLLTELVDAGVFVDVLDVVRQSLRVGAESYGLKVLEQAAGFERGHEIDAGAGAVVEYDAWMRDADDDRLARIARYNEDDVVATKAVRDWLLSGPLAHEQRREDVVAVEQEHDTDELVAALMAREQEWTTLLAHLLEYWSREGRAHRAQTLSALTVDEADRLADPSVISGLEFVTVLPLTGRQRIPRALFSFPTQEVAPDLDKVMFPIGDGAVWTLKVHRLDVAAGEVEFPWPEGKRDVIPTAVVKNDWYSPGKKPGALADFARRVLDDETTAPDDLRKSLLEGQLPTFTPGKGPIGGAFPTATEQIVDVAAALTGGCLPVQGPPGTGKTYTGAKVIARLLADGKRVAVTAFSHAAINNLVRAVLKERPETRVLRGGDPPESTADRIPTVKYAGSVGPKTWAASAGAPGGYELWASTTWALASEAAAGTADVLVIDEAGQMGLADALAGMSCATSAIMLGDPLQLAQVSLASHPSGSGASALEHVLAGDATIPPERGVFLETTWRMHPTLCGFLSEQIYDGRLGSHENCAWQSVGARAGLRWIRAEHEGRDTSSPEEAVLVADTIRGLLGQPYIDFDGVERPLLADDVMVVAPYNDHVDLVRETLASDSTLAGARVGTVDKFQGQEAPVVIFTMATSSGADLPRTVDFLYSRNRLNVAVSRARALAYVVCTEDLLDARASTVADMRLIGTLCAFVEAADLAD